MFDYTVLLYAILLVFLTLFNIWYSSFALVKSSHKEVFCKKGVLRSFTKFKRKHLCQSLVFNKVAVLSLQLYQKRNSGTSVFLWILSKFLRTPFLTDHLRWLLLFGLHASISHSRLSTRRRIKSSVKFLRWSFLRKKLTASCYCFISSAKTNSHFLLEFNNLDKIYVTTSATGLSFKKNKPFTFPPPKFDILNHLETVYSGNKCLWPC